MPERHHPDPAQIPLTVLLRALGEPLRLRMIDLLARNGEMKCAEIYRHLGITKTAASHHFTTLREAGVLRSRTSGRDHYASLRRVELDEHFPGLLDAVLRSVRRRLGGDGREEPDNAPTVATEPASESAGQEPGPFSSLFTPREPSPHRWK